MKKFRLTAEAAADLTEIFDYIAEDSLDAAQRFTSEISDEMRKLAQNPGIGHKRPDLTNRDLLFWRMYSYLIIYQPTRPVNVIAVLHGSRDVKRVVKKR